MALPDMLPDFTVVFDTQKEYLIGAEAKIVLLKEGDSPDPFTTLQTITTGWYSKYSQFFGNTTFNIADVSPTTSKNIRDAGFLSVRDSSLTQFNNILFEIRPETVPPDADYPYWRVRAVALDRKYVPPEEI